jgi:hypothetical protein
MTPSEAREHLEMAERIVAASTRELSLKYAAPFFILWGLFGGTVDLLAQLNARGVVSNAFALAISIAILVFAIVASSVYGRRLRRAKCGITFVQREFLNVLWIALGCAFVSEFAGSHLFQPPGYGAVWTIAAAIVLFYIGMHANRRAVVAGIILLASLFVANYTPSLIGYILAAGFYVGYAGFGVAELLSRE